MFVSVRHLQFTQSRTNDHFLFKNSLLSGQYHLSTDYEKARATDPELNYEPFKLRTYHQYLLKTGFGDDPHLREEARHIILTLRHLNFYLTYHSWGNLKKLSTALEEFIHPVPIPEERKSRMAFPPLRKTTLFMLSINFVEHQRILLASHIFIPLSHHIGRKLQSSDDKVKIIAFSALNYILRFHRRGFSRRYLERMVDAINIHSSPHLDDIIFSLLEIVLKPYVRTIRNGFLRYRFVTGFEREIEYICRVSDMESASFNFSMAAADKVKRHYKSLLQEGRETITGNNEELSGSSEILRGILGNFYFFGENYDQAAEYFRKTLIQCEKSVINPNENSDISQLNVYLFTTLKLGNLYERRHNYYSAEFHYQRACQIVNKWIDFEYFNEHSFSKGIIKGIEQGDSKWNIFLQPFICSAYLALKHGPEGEKNISFPKYLDLDDKPGTWIRKGRLSFFLNRFQDGLQHFLEAYKRAEKKPGHSFIGENHGFWRAVALSSIAECLLNFKMQIELKALNDTSKKSIANNISNEFETSGLHFLKFIDFLSNEEAIKIDDLDSLRRTIDIDDVVKSVRNNIESGEYFPPDPKINENDSLAIPPALLELSFKEILGLLLESADQFKQLDLPDYETRVYFKIMSYWTTIQGFVPKKLIVHFKPSPLGHTQDEIEMFEKFDQIRQFAEGKTVNDILEDVSVLPEIEKILGVSLNEIKNDNIKKKNFDEIISFLRNYEDELRLLKDNDFKKLYSKAKVKIFIADLEKAILKFEKLQLPFWSINFSRLLKIPLYSSLKTNLIKNEHWVKVVREEASRAVGGLHHGAYNAFLNKHLEKDLYEQEFPGISMALPYAPTTKEAFKMPWKHLFENSERRQESSFWFRSALGQHVLTTGVLEKNYRNSLLKILGESNAPLTKINNLHMPPYSAQSRTLALWLDANWLSAKISNNVQQLNELDYRDASKAIRNYYWAVQTAQLVSGNHQGMMFISKYLIFYNLWEFIHGLIEFSVRSMGSDAQALMDKFENKEKMDSIDSWRFKDYFLIAEASIQQGIRPILGDEVPHHFTDYEYIKKRAIQYLNEIELNGNPTNKARRNILKLKYYIDDDFEDTQFIMEWTMNQMFSPAAYMHRRTIEEFSFKFTEEFQSLF